MKLILHRFCVFWILLYAAKTQASLKKKLFNQIQWVEENCPTLQTPLSEDCATMVWKIQKLYHQTSFSKDPIEPPLLEPLKKILTLTTDEITTALWHANQSLSIEEFYKKYQKKFEKYKIHLTFEENLMTTCPHSDTTNFSGNHYKKRHWTNALEKELNLTTQHALKAKVLAQAYENHILPQIQEQPLLQEQFQWFMSRYANYFGSQKHSIKKPLSLYHVFAPFLQKPSFIKAFYDFEQEIRALLNSPLPLEHPQKKIAILTGPYGGGHLSVAHLLQTTLTQAPENYQVTLWNECTDFADSLFLASCGQIRACQIYNEISVKEDNPIKATLLYILNNKITDYIPQNRFGELHETLQKTQPDLMISTLHHILEITQLSYLLDTPLRIFITDYEFPEKQWHALNHEHSDLVRYWIPTLDPEFFRPMMKNYIPKTWEAMTSHSRTATLYKKVFLEQRSLKSILPELDVFDFLPFPVSPDIHPPEDEAAILLSREQLGLSTDLTRKIVSIAYGHSTKTSLILNQIHKLLENAHQLISKIQLAILTAGNASLTQALEPLLIKMNDSNENLVTGTALHHLKNPEEMSLLYQATDLFLSKSGGASTSELIQSQTYFLRGFSLWPWEIENTKLLERQGLTLTPLEDSHPYTQDPESDWLLEQMNTLLSKQKITTPPTSPFSPEVLFHLIKHTLKTTQASQRRFDQKTQEMHQLHEFLQTLQLKPITTTPLHTGQDGCIYLFLNQHQEPFIVKIPKEHPHLTLHQIEERLKNENETLNQLEHIIPHQVCHSELYHYRHHNQEQTLLLKNFIPGKTLFELLKNKEMTQEMISQLNVLFQTLIQHHLYVTDLHGFNLIYSEKQKNWVIIDSNGSYPTFFSPHLLYFHELSHHWAKEIKKHSPITEIHSLFLKNFLSTNNLKDYRLRLTNPFHDPY